MARVEPRLNTEQCFPRSSLALPLLRSETHLNTEVTLYTSPPCSSTTNKYYILSFLIVMHFCTLAVLSRYPSAHIHIFHKLWGKGRRKRIHFRPVVFKINTQYSDESNSCCFAFFFFVLSSKVNRRNSFNCSWSLSFYCTEMPRYHLYVFVLIYIHFPPAFPSIFQFPLGS